MGSLGRVTGPIIAGLLYEHVAKIAPFAASAIIISAMGVWLALVSSKVTRAKRASEQPEAAAEVVAEPA